MNSDLDIEIVLSVANLKKTRINDPLPELDSIQFTPYSTHPLENEFLKIYLLKNAYDEINTFSKGDLLHERGGVLVGSVNEDQHSLVIKGGIPALEAEGTSVSLKFTHQSWNYIHAMKEKHFPTERIVGWFHTHPQMGIFLSGHDIFIQKNFFNIEWQVAYVLDPVNEDQGFFYWSEAHQITRSKGFYLEK